MTSRPILTAAQMLAAEEELMATGVSVDVLMERAGRAVADIAWRIAGKTSVLVACGPGNNGGDGYVIARILAERGCDVRVVALSKPGTDASVTAESNWDGTTVALEDAAPASMFIDALFGTGLKRPLDDQLSLFLAKQVECAKHAIAVDIPSGVEADSGEELSPVPTYDVTVALGALKPAHLLQPASQKCGRTTIGDIGIICDSDCQLIGSPRVRAPGPRDHKYTRGFVFVAEGTMAGAASLTANASAKSGAGYVVMAGPERGTGPQALIMKQAADPKTLGKLLADERIDSVVIGPGLGLDKKARARLDMALASGRKLVLDADALTLLAEKGLERLRELPLAPILTPHSGEFTRLFGKNRESKLERTRRAAAETNTVIVNKGADTVVAAPDGRTAILPTSPSWLASAGTGDVLSGVIATRYAQSDDPFKAACDGVWLHREAALRAGEFLIADDLIDALPSALRSCL